jgi:hypothetical protein
MIKPRRSELIFAGTEDVNGGFVAECMTESIVTQGESWDELCQRKRRGAKLFFRWRHGRRDSPPPCAG